MSDLHYMSIADAGRLIRDGDLSPVDFVEALLTRISQIDPKLDAFLAVAGEQARADAQARGRARGRRAARGGGDGRGER